MPSTSFTTNCEFRCADNECTWDFLFFFDTNETASVLGIELLFSKVYGLCWAFSLKQACLKKHAARAFRHGERLISHWVYNLSPLGIKPATIPFGLGISPPSSDSVGSSQTKSMDFKKVKGL